MWYLKWNKDLAFYYERIRQRCNAKELEPDLGEEEFYITAFFELNSCRGGMGDGPIPFTAIYDFAKIYEVRELDEFLYIIRWLDGVYLETKAKENGNNTRNDSKDPDKKRNKGP